MPALAAHYKFGQLVFEKLSVDTQKIIKHNKSMFDLGLQGPDLLFYYKPQNKNEISKSGHNMHSKKGSEFFLDIVKNKNNIKDSQKSYIIGACCHYALDRNCHPIINEYTKTSIEHQILESEFDRLILTKYKLSDKRFKMIPVKNIDVEEISKVYKGIDKSKIRESAYTMRIANRFLQHKGLVEKIENLLSKPKVFSTLSIPQKIESDSRAYDILYFFDKAVLDAVNLIEIITKDEIDEKEIKENMVLNFEGVLI